MKYLYVDEAGKSRKETNTVVVGVIVDADKQWREAERAITALADEFVPEHLRKGFYFHAVDVYAGGREVEGWPLEQRLRLISGMLKTPRIMNMPLTLGMVRRDPPAQKIGRFEPHEMDHIDAFMNMVVCADRYMRRESGRDEVLTVVCEDVERVKDACRALVAHVRANPIKFDPSLLVLTEDEQKHGPDGGEYAITRIVDTIHFVEKKNGPLLQIADACAYAFKRYFEGKSRSQEWLENILGQDLKDKQLWKGKSHGQTFQWTRPKSVSAAEVIPFRVLG